MTSIKNTILKFLTKWGYDIQTSITGARIILNNARRIDLKVNYTQEELNTFLRELDIEVDMDIEHVRGNIWLDNGKVAELDYYDSLGYAEWVHIYIPPIPEDLLS